MYRRIIKLRALVGFLGEEDQFEWWDTSFMDSTGQRFLERSFPRDPFQAGLHSVTVAARKLHDESIGKGDVAHLFRLPHAREQRLAEMLRKLEVSLQEELSSQENALEALKETAVEVPDAVGAVQIGSGLTLTSESSVAAMAGHYYRGFTNGHTIFPYVTSE